MYEKQVMSFSRHNYVFIGNPYADSVHRCSATFCAFLIL